MAGRAVTATIALILLGTSHCSEYKDSFCGGAGPKYDVSGTGISVINMTSVSQNQRATCVNVSHNQISLLTNDTFDKFWTLMSLDMSYNNLTKLPPGLLQSLRFLKFLYVTHNSLTTLPGELLKWTSQLLMANFSHNPILDLPLDLLNHSLSELRYVDVTYSDLTAFEPWNYVNKEMTTCMLDLRWGNISVFSNRQNLTVTNVFDKRVADRSLVTDLRHNSLRHWDMNIPLKYADRAANVTIEQIMLAMRPDVRDNPWFCDCEVYNFAYPLSDTFSKWSRHPLLTIACYDPPELRDKQMLYDLELKDFVCNITQNCPDNCLCQDRPDSGEMNVDCRGRNLTKFPLYVPHSRYGKLSLQLDDNFITSIPNVSYSKRIWYMSLRNNTLTSINAGVIEDIAAWQLVGIDSEVDIRDNRLTSLPVTFKKINYKFSHIHGNRLVCTCDMLWMTEWINDAPKEAYKDVLCDYKGDIYKIIDIDEEILDCHENGSIVLILILSGVALIVILLFITAKRCPYETKVLLYKIFRIHPMDKYRVDAAEDSAYDMYVSFDENDVHVCQWVKRVLVRQLEGRKPFYRLSLACRDMQAGAEGEARLDLMEASRRVLIILSHQYEASAWAQYDALQTECLAETDGRVIYLLYGRAGAALADREPWKSRISGRKCFKVGCRMFWSKLRYELPVKPAKARSKY